MTLHLLTLIVVVRSGLPLEIKLLLGFLVLIAFTFIVRNSLPLPNYQKLSYHPGHWLLHERNGKQIKYERASISFEGGIFVLLSLTGISRNKTMVVFKDQMNIDQYRILKFMK